MCCCFHYGEGLQQWIYLVLRSLVQCKHQVMHQRGHAHAGQQWRVRTASMALSTCIGIALGHNMVGGARVSGPCVQHERMTTSSGQLSLCKEHRVFFTASCYRLAKWRVHANKRHSTHWRVRLSSGARMISYCRQLPDCIFKAPRAAVSRPPFRSCPQFVVRFSFSPSLQHVCQALRWDLAWLALGLPSAASWARFLTSVLASFFANSRQLELGHQQG